MRRLAGYRHMEAFALAGLGDLYRDLEAFTEANEAYRQAALLAGRVGEPYLVFYLDLARGVLARQQLQFASAREYFQAAAARVAQGLSQAEQAACDLELATLALVQNQPERVPEILAAAGHLLTPQNARVESARGLLLQMLSAAAQGQRAAALSHCQHLNDISEHFPDPLAALGNRRARTAALAGAPFKPARTAAPGRAPAAPGPANWASASTGCAASCAPAPGWCRSAPPR